MLYRYKAGGGKNIYDNYLMALNNFSSLLLISAVFGCRKRHVNDLKTTHHLKVEGGNILTCGCLACQPVQHPRNINLTL